MSRDDGSEHAIRIARLLARIALGTLLLVAGTAHLGEGRAVFAAQVPDWVPLDEDLVIVASGLVELALGAAVILLPRHQAVIGWAIAGFFVLVFPGNIAQFVDRVDAFGLDTDIARGIRLLFQPVLVAWALWATGAWHGRATMLGALDRGRRQEDGGIR